MSDRERTSPESEDAEVVEHGDIVRRLVEYQRQLREGASPHEAAERASQPLIDYAALERRVSARARTSEIVDVAAAEAQAAWAQAPSGPVIEIPEAAGEVPAVEVAEAAEVAKVAEAAKMAKVAEVAEVAPEAKAEVPRILAAAPPAAAKVAPASKKRGNGKAAREAPSTRELEARVEALETTLAELSKALRAMRKASQESALLVDEGLADMQRRIRRATGRPDDVS